MSFLNKMFCKIKTLQQKQSIGSTASDSSKFYAEVKFAPPGHFYSPIPSLHDVKEHQDRIYGKRPRILPDVDMHEEEQLKLLHHFIQYYQDLPFQDTKAQGLRYYYHNPSYSYSDAILLHCMLRDIKPKRLIEVGSGHSSCITLDTNELHFNNSIETTFIEPNPQLFLSLITKEDKQRVKMIPQRLQDTDISVFSKLEKNDILFIDSTHVGKIDSDVNYLFFKLLPTLSSGVYVHIHDIFYPFEYPIDWIEEGRAFNEAYMLRTFLAYNKKFKIILMNDFMNYFHSEFFAENMPLCVKNSGGSIWLKVE